MLLSELIADLRLDLSDPGASLFEDQTLERCVRKCNAPNSFVYNAV